MIFLKNIRSGNATASEYVSLLNERGSSILIDNIVKHEQKKKDKSTRLLKEIESEIRDAVNLLSCMRILYVDYRTIDQGGSSRGSGTPGRSVVLFLCAHRTRNRCLTGMIFSNSSCWTMPQTKIRSGSCMKNWIRRYSNSMFLFSLSSLLQLTPVLLCRRADTHGRKVGNDSQARQVARKESHKGTNSHKKVL